MSSLRDRIKTLAASKGLSLPKLEAEMGFGNGTIVKWEKTNPTVDKLQRVADYFNVSVDYLLGREEQKEKPLPFSENGALVAEIYDSLSDANKLKLSTYLLQLQKENEDK